MAVVAPSRDLQRFSALVNHTRRGLKSPPVGVNGR